MARETFASKVTFFPFVDGVFGEPIPLKHCVGFNTKSNYKEIEYSSDGTIEKSSSKIESVDIELEMSTAMGLDTMSKITGQVYENAKQVTRVGQAIQQGAYAYEIAMDDGSYRRRVLYSANLRNDEKNNSTDSEGETVTFTGKAIPFEAIVGFLDVDLTMDSKEVAKSIDEAIKLEFKNFFTEVVLPPVPVALKLNK